LKQKCSEYVLEILKKMKKTEIEKNGHLSQIENSIKISIEDGSKEVRDTSRTCFWEFYSLWENKAKTMLENMNPKTKKFINETKTVKEEINKKKSPVKSFHTPLSKLETNGTTKVNMGNKKYTIEVKKPFSEKVINNENLITKNLEKIKETPNKSRFILETPNKNRFTLETPNKIRIIQETPNKSRFTLETPNKNKIIQDLNKNKIPLESPHRFKGKMEVTPSKKKKNEFLKTPNKVEKNEYKMIQKFNENIQTKKSIEPLKTEPTPSKISNILKKLETQKTIEPTIELDEFIGLSNSKDINLRLKYYDDLKNYFKENKLMSIENIEKIINVYIQKFKDTNLMEKNIYSIINFIELYYKDIQVDMLMSIYEGIFTLISNKLNSDYMIKLNQQLLTTIEKHMDIKVVYQTLFLSLENKSISLEVLNYLTKLILKQKKYFNENSKIYL
jgi:hypothetical protein